MDKFLGTVRLGTLYHNSESFALPSRPFVASYIEGYNDSDGSITRFYGDMKDWTIGNTSSNENEKLRWVKVRYKNKILLICDRNILAYMSWNDLYDAGYIEGKTITIDGEKFICRVLTGGSYYKDSSNSNAGGYPVSNEWDSIICNGANISGLPNPAKNDLDDTCTQEDLNGEHNQFWNWASMYSWCQEKYGNDSNDGVYRGKQSAMHFWSSSRNSHCNLYGWRPVLQLINTIPSISDTDRNLGNKTEGFDISYTVTDSDNDTLTIIEKLNNTTLRTLNNAPKNKLLTLNITDEALYQLPINDSNTLSICVDDGRGGIAYRNYTFTRTNTAPIISDQDRELGVVDRTVKQSYRVHDEENDSINIFESLDDIKLNTFKAESNKEYTIEIPANIWVLLKNGQHKLTIAATDSNNAKSIRTYTFTKKETKINLTLKNALKTDDRANKILITPVWQGIENANVKVEVCNNANDKEPTWEDCTKSVLANQHYNFTNKEKTADTWGINIRFDIEKKEGITEEIYFNGFGGAYE